MSKQNFTFWFTEWPSTHVNAGKTVEVMPREVFEKADREYIGYIDFWRDETLRAEAEAKLMTEKSEFLMGALRLITNAPDQGLRVASEAIAHVEAMESSALPEDRSDFERDYVLARELIGKAETNGAFADDDDPHALRDAVKRLHGRLAEVKRLRAIVERQDNGGGAVRL